MMSFMSLVGVEEWSNMGGFGCFSRFFLLLSGPTRVSTGDLQQKRMRFYVNTIKPNLQKTTNHKHQPLAKHPPNKENLHK